VKWIISVRPNFSDIKYIKSIAFCVLFRHYLYFPCPWWEVSLDYSVKQVSGWEIFILDCHLIKLLCSKILNSLIGFEMIFDVVDFTFRVDPLECMRTIAIHKSISVRSTPIRKQYSDLMQSLWSVLPEIKDSIWIC
jgi:hypothetical protein